MAKRKRQTNPLGAFLRKTRSERGWNQEQLAAVTFSTRYLRAVEKGSCLASPLALQVLAKHLDLERQRRVEELHINIDQAKKARQVEAITGTEYFIELQARATALLLERKERDGSSHGRQ